MDPSAPSSNKRKRSNDGSPSDNPRQLSGMDLKSIITLPDLRRSDSSITDSPAYMREPFDTISQFGSRDSRRLQAHFFVDYYARHHSDYPVIKGCTWVRADRFWRDKSLGITWVALQGIDSLCVVTRHKDLVHLENELSRSGDAHTTDAFLRYFWNAIVSEVEGIEDLMIGRSKRLFSVVSVISGTSKVCKRSGHEVSWAEYCAEKTSKFLQEEMKSGAAFTFDKTVQTAISACQHLFRREFKAYEIRVFVWKKDDIIGKELQQMREKPDLEHLLASMNEPDNDPDAV